MKTSHKKKVIFLLTSIDFGHEYEHGIFKVRWIISEYLTDFDVI